MVASLLSPGPCRPPCCHPAGHAAVSRTLQAILLSHGPRRPCCTTPIPAKLHKDTWSRTAEHPEGTHPRPGSESTGRQLSLAQCPLFISSTWGFRFTPIILMGSGWERAHWAQTTKT